MKTTATIFDENDTPEVVEIEFDYHRPEPATLEYPGCEQQIEVTAVWQTCPYRGTKSDINGLLSDANEQHVTEACWEAVHDATAEKMLSMEDFT